MFLALSIPVSCLLIWQHKILYLSPLIAGVIVSLLSVALWIFTVNKPTKHNYFRFAAFYWLSNFMPQQAYMNNGIRYNENGEEVSTTKDAKINGLIRMPLKRDIYVKLYRDNDSRKRVNLRAVYQKDTNGNLVYEAAYPYKYQGTTLTGASTRSMYDDYPIYRYADCLLLLAEAKYLLGEDIATEINIIRKRAYGDNYSDKVAYPNDKGSFYDDNKFVGGDEDPVEAILKERLRELIFEGRNWYDIRLLNMTSKYSTATSTRLLWPIDESTLTNNNKLVQTDGY